MINARKIKIYLLLFCLFSFLYGNDTVFKPKFLNIFLNKTRAISDGSDKILLTYNIKDNNGVPLRGEDLKKTAVFIDGKRTNMRSFTSYRSGVYRITVVYGKLKAEKKIEFIDNINALIVHLSKKNILANGRDKIFFSVVDNKNRPWNSHTEYYINNKKIKNSSFKTVKSGIYTVSAKSGSFRSKKRKIRAYDRIKKLFLTSNKLIFLANNIDFIQFNLSGTDQNGVVKTIKNFEIVNQNGSVISKNGTLTSQKEKTYKIRALYNEQYSNYLDLKSKLPEVLKVIYSYPQKSTINLNGDIKIKLNNKIKNYNGNFGVFLNEIPIQGKIIYNKKTDVLKFHPNKPLKLNGSYKVVLNKKVEGINGNKLKKEFVFYFTAVSQKKINMVRVNRGKFILGDGSKTLKSFCSPTQNVSITYDYFIGEKEVTFDIYDQYTRDMRLPLVDDNRWGRKNHPVINVSWFDAIKFLNWLSLKKGLPVAYDKNGDLVDANYKNTRDITKVLGYRLPTEIEWEFAGKSRIKKNPTLFSGSNIIDKVGWFSKNSNNRTHYVGTKAPNKLNIYDMTGNVWEWINDYSGVYSGIERINSVGPENGNLKIIRGGSFNSIKNNSRLTFRNELSPYNEDIYYGFRAARTIYGGKK